MLTANRNRLEHLIARVAGRDRSAFALLYEATYGSLRDGLESRLGDTTWASDVLVAMYVEVWWLAGRHIGPDFDAEAWINEIGERRGAEGPPVPRQPDCFAGTRSAHAKLELDRLLR